MSDRTLFLNATHLNAHMLCLNHHDGTKRIECLLKTITNLFGEVFLHLQTMGEDVHHTRNLAEPYNIAIGNVCHMHLSEERQDMMFTKGVELNVLHHHHLIVFFMEHGRLECSDRIHRITSCQFQKSACQTFRSALQPLTLRVLTNCFKAFLTSVFQKFYLFFSIHFVLSILLIDIHFTLDNDGTLCQPRTLQFVEIVIRFPACDKIAHTASPVR